MFHHARRCDSKPLHHGHRRHRPSPNPLHRRRSIPTRGRSPSHAARSIKRHERCSQTDEILPYLLHSLRHTDSRPPRLCPRNRTLRRPLRLSLRTAPRHHTLLHPPQNHNPPNRLICEDEKAERIFSIGERKERNGVRLFRNCHFVCDLKSKGNFRWRLLVLLLRRRRRYFGEQVILCIFFVPLPSCSKIIRLKK